MNSVTNPLATLALPWQNMQGKHLTYGEKVMHVLSSESSSEIVDLRENDSIKINYLSIIHSLALEWNTLFQPAWLCMISMVLYTSLYSSIWWIECSLTYGNIVIVFTVSPLELISRRSQVRSQQSQYPPWCSSWTNLSWIPLPFPTLNSVWGKIRRMRKLSLPPLWSNRAESLQFSVQRKEAETHWRLCMMQTVCLYTRHAHLCHGTRLSMIIYTYSINSDGAHCLPIRVIRSSVLKTESFLYWRHILRLTVGRVGCCG